MSPDPFESTKESIENEARKTADSSWDSPFHTIGKGATQAAPGNHTHPATDIKDLPAGLALSNAIPKQDAGSGSAGTGVAASRDDHVHPPTPGISLGTSVPPADSGSGAVGVLGAAARADHQHPTHNVPYADSAAYAANADTVDGYHATSLSKVGHTHTVDYAATAGSASTADNADKVDGYHASSLSKVGHTHNPSDSGIIPAMHGPYSVGAGDELIIGPFTKKSDEYVLYSLFHSSAYINLSMPSQNATNFTIKIRNTTSGTNHSGIYVMSLRVRNA
jgi:hypothetical protein